MKEVNDLFDIYREAIRNLWNCYFRHDGEYIPPENVQDSFERISSEMFSIIVLHELGIARRGGQVSEMVDGIFDVILKYDETPTFINRSIPASGYWDNEIKTIKKGVSLRFLDFFDWDNYEFLDMQFLRVRIMDADIVQSQLIGMDALIECRNARLVLSDSLIR